jgi:DNA primase catalytic subunit
MHSQYNLPGGMGYSLLSERKEFYKKEFDIKKVGLWLRKHRNPLSTVFAVVVGRHTGIFLSRFRRFTKSPVLIDEYENLGEVGKTIEKFLPEGVYYDRNVYKDLGACGRCKKSYGDCWGCDGFLGQELAFDIDPENIPCPKCGTLKEKLARHQGLGFCEYELGVAKEQAFGLQRELKRRFRSTEVVYSGRGYHVHVFDKKARKMSRKERGELARKMREKGYLIDSWVTEGESRLIRLPYSLHGMVSRIVLPVKNEELPAFDPLKDSRCRPKFL